MAMVVAKQGLKAALADPRIQALALDLAIDAGRSISNKSRKKKKKNNNGNNQQMVLYQQPRSKQYAPVAVNTNARTRRARITGMSGGIVIKHREYIGQLSGSTTFNAQSYQLQPGLHQSFPWLAGIANNFEKYRVRNMRLDYVNVSATSERGRITLAYDKDPLDSDPRNKIELFAYEGAKEGSVWSPLSLPIPCKGTELFTRSGTVPGTDLKTYDLGKIIAAASNNADTAVVGELFLQYEIELITPQPVSCPSTYVTANNTILAPFGTSPTVTGNFPATFVDDTITFLAPGTYLVSLLMSNGVGLTGSTRGGTCTVGAVLTAVETAKLSVIIECRAAVAGDTFTIAGIGTSSSSMYCYVTMTGGLVVA